MLSFGCIPCDFNYYLNSDHYCELCSSPEQIKKGSNNGTGLCIECSSQYDTKCATCNDVQCLTCKDGYFLSGVVCEPCTSNCFSCISPKCEVCFDNYALDDDGKCTLCIGEYI